MNKFSVFAFALLHSNVVATYFAVKSGGTGCTVVDNCMYSPNYPSNYNDNDSCEFSVITGTRLNVVAFQLESCCDYVYVGGVGYNGATGPSNVYVSSGDSITFATDGSVTYSGFEICAASGTCVSGSNSVQMWSESAGAPVQTPLHQVKVGDRILARSTEGKLVYTPVRGLPHSETKEAFVEIQMASPAAAEKSDYSLLATKMHTFPKCDGSIVSAHDVQTGDCLFTLDGEGRVKHVNTAAEDKEEADTYTIDVDEDVDAVAVGGVFTHARSGNLLHEHPISEVAKNRKIHKESAKGTMNVRKAFLRNGKN
jgi:hypothetical protein